MAWSLHIIVGTVILVTLAPHGVCHRIVASTERTLDARASARYSVSVSHNTNLRSLANLSASNSCPSHVMQDFPPLKGVNGAAGFCGEPLFGVLVVGCKSASDLKNVDWMSKSDPFCRVRLSDTKKTEVRGVLHQQRKYVPRSESHQTRTIDNDLNPKWNEVFTFSMLCPQSPDSEYQLEVTIKDEDITKNAFLGSVYIPLAEIKSQKVSGPVAYKLEENRAAREEPKHSQGSVKLYIQWCEWGDTSCIGAAVAESGAEGQPETIVVDCEMSCHHAWPRVPLAVDGLRSAIEGAQSAASTEQFMDTMEDIYESLEDNAEDAGDEEAEERYDDIADHFDDMGDFYEDEVKRKWSSAQKKMASLESMVLKQSHQACGPRISAAVSAAVRRLGAAPRGKFKSSTASSLLSRVNHLKHELESIGSCIEGKLLNNELLPSPKKVGARCSSYF